MCYDSKESPSQMKNRIVFIIIIFWLCTVWHVACGMLVPQPGMEPVLRALTAGSLSHWTTAATAAAKSCQSCPTLCDPTDSSPPGSHPWDSPGKNTGVGCHFLLQCMKVKSESEVAQSCPTLCDPMDCSLPGSSCHGISQARVLEWVATAFSTRKS